MVFDVLVQNFDSDSDREHFPLFIQIVTRQAALVHRLQSLPYYRVISMKP